MGEASYLVFETGGTKLVAGVADPDCRILETAILHRETGDRAAKSFRRLIKSGRRFNATIGFKRLAGELGKHEKSLMQMLGPAGNPQARNLFAIIETLQRLEGVELGVVVMN